MGSDRFIHFLCCTSMVNVINRDGISVISIRCPIVYRLPEICRSRWTCPTKFENVRQQAPGSADMMSEDAQLHRSKCPTSHKKFSWSLSLAPTVILCIGLQSAKNLIGSLSERYSWLLLKPKVWPFPWWQGITKCPMSMTNKWMEGATKRIIPLLCWSYKNQIKYKFKATTGGLWNPSRPSLQNLCHWSNPITNLWECVVVVSLSWQ